MHETDVPGVSPTTAALLRWWFDPPSIAARGGWGFHEKQRQAILAAIRAHEALDGPALQHGGTVHRLALAHGVDQIHVLLALLTWQLLNHLDARAQGRKDARFTSHFMLVAHHACVRSRLFELCAGPLSGVGFGMRDFGNADLVRLAPLLIPEPRRTAVFNFVRNRTVSGAQYLRHASGDGVLAITDGRLEALECIAHLPEAMVFDDETRPPFFARSEDPGNGMVWRRHLRRVALARAGWGVQVVFVEEPPTRGTTPRAAA